MGILSAIRGKQIYLDTNIWIYALEGYPAFISAVTTLFQSVDKGELEAVTSELTLAEVLVKPLSNQDTALQTAYKQAIQSSAQLSVIPVSRDILIKAAQLRASANLKLPDAIHAATALLAECSTFLTNDQQFQLVPELHVVLLSQIALP